MPVTLTITDGLEAVFQKFGDAKVCHPIELDRAFVGSGLLVTFSDDGEGNVTVALSARGTHKWPFASEPSLSFDDRSLT